MLLIACANVANLLLARSLEQRREIAMRLALGISRRRLIAQCLAEGFMMAGLGGAAALALARWGGGTLQRVLLPGVAWGEVVTVRLLAVLLLVVVAAGVVCALLPALEASRSDPARVLKALPGSPGRSVVRLRSWLATTQVALTVVLLAGAGLFLRSLGRAQAMAPGSGDGHVLTMWPVLGPGVEIDLSTPDTRLMFETVRGRLAGIPGIEAVAVSSDYVPFRYAGSTPPLRATGHDSIASPHGGMPYRFRVSPEYFRVLGFRMEAGRGIEPTDRRGSERVAVVSQSMSASLWPGGDALDRCLFVDASDTCVRIVGVVSDTRVGSIDETTPFAYYLPYAQDDGGAPYLIVRTQVAPKQMEGLIQRRLAGLDDRVRAWVVEDFHGEIFGAHVSSWKLGSTLFAGFGLLATVVAMVGLYAVLAFDVEERRREIGLRTALGASRDGIVAMFVRRATRLTVAGSAAGIVLALLLAPRIQPLLFQTSAHDPLTFGGIAAALALVGVAAAGIPTWRAARVDPNVVLREE